MENEKIISLEMENEEIISLEMSDEEKLKYFLYAAFAIFGTKIDITKRIHITITNDCEGRVWITDTVSGKFYHGEC